MEERSNIRVWSRKMKNRMMKLVLPLKCCYVLCWWWSCWTKESWMKSAHQGSWDLPPGLEQMEHVRWEEAVSAMLSRGDMEAYRCLRKYHLLGLRWEQDIRRNPKPGLRGQKIAESRTSESEVADAMHGQETKNSQEVIQGLDIV